MHPLNRIYCDLLVAKQICRTLGFPAEAISFVIGPSSQSPEEGPHLHLVLEQDAKRFMYAVGPAPKGLTTTNNEVMALQHAMKDDPDLAARVYETSCLSDVDNLSVLLTGMIENAGVLPPGYPGPTKH